MTFEPLQQFYEEHTVWIGGAAGLSIFLLIGSLLMAPWLLSRLPADYFQNPHHQPLESLVHLPLIRWPLIMLKNHDSLLFVRHSPKGDGGGARLAGRPGQKGEQNV